jgi:hypothetical protein
MVVWFLCILFPSTVRSGNDEFMWGVATSAYQIEVNLSTILFPSEDYFDS